MNENNTADLISVILPTYNAEKTVDRCLESILRQTHQNIEVICCDDCSRDGTWDKLQEWAKRDSRITVMQNEVNSRAAFTRNRCIEAAKGEWIAQIDDDDYCADDRLERQLDFLKNHPEYGFVGTGAYFFDENGIWGQTEREEGYAPLASSFLWSAVFMNPSMMYRTEVMRSVDGYRVAKETRRSQDYDMHMRMYAAGHRGYVMADRLTYYYRGKNSYPKCKYRYRIDECKIRFRNFRALGLMPKGFFYAMKPLLVGLVPISWVEEYKKRKQERKARKNAKS